MALSDYKALSFDCYGTLIDWESGMIHGLFPLTEKLSRPMGRNAILQAHAHYESAQQLQTPTMPYRNLLAIVYKRLAESWGIAVSDAECRAYGQSIGYWPAFPDSAEAMQYLKKHFKLIILSNIDNQSFAASQLKLEVAFDAVYTAEDIGSYKPSARNFDYMLQNIAALGLRKTDLLHTAESLFHDHAPANHHGIANCWIYRRHNDEGYGATMDPGTMPGIDFRFNSMADLAEAHRREQA